MIYIGTMESNGSAIYFDIYSTVRQGQGTRISGTIGDGCYEGEVLVELGRSESVTFADAWLGGEGFSEFIDRCGSDALKSALLESVREMRSRHARRDRPHGNAPLKNSAPLVLESPPTWRHGA